VRAASVGRTASWPSCASFWTCRNWASPEGGLDFDQSAADLIRRRSKPAPNRAHGD
jgi:hypothetical protein